MILVIDNYDSFTHNLARYVREEGAHTHTLYNDEKSVAECLDLDPQAVIVSPGPNTPAQAGISCDLIRALEPTTPMLGVCLGHQCLIEVYGGHTQRARQPLHGEACLVRHDGGAIFEGIAMPMAAGRYHSLIGAPKPGGTLIETAWAENGEVMAVRHRERPYFGVQFHPESLLTPEGRKIIRNFVKICGADVK